ncbi:MFS transporter [Aeromicrobium sp. CF4.19]|uniref:MFS transporter n=1 Tax=Aeromicrobium sp. CF4.19 TaxID=3373082 RepID=UPI003EE7C91D
MSGDHAREGAVEQNEPGAGDAPTTEVTRSEIRTVLLSCIVGTTVEWYDFFLYGVAAGIVFNQLYFPSEDPVVGTLLAFATFAVGFVARPIGGLIFGHIGDRIGRKKTLVMTMLIMGFATCLIGLIPTYESIGVAAPIILICLRIMQGIAIGGEWGGAVLMAVEYAPKDRKGIFGSFPQMGLAFGLILGTGVFALLELGLTDEAFLAWGWRVAFLLSAVLVFVGLYIRLKVLETPAFRKLEEREEKAAVPAVELFKDKRNRRHIWLGMGARWIEGVAFNAFAVFAITYGVDTVGTSRQTMLVAVMIAAVVLGVTIPLAGRLSDRFDRRRTYTVGIALTALTAYPVFTLLDTGNPVVITLALVLALGIIYPIMYGPEAALFSELFPAHVRYTGISFVYQFSGIFASGLTPLILVYLLDQGSGTSLVIAYFVVVAIISAVCCMMIRRSDLEQIEADSEIPDLVDRPV